MFLHQNSPQTEIRRVLGFKQAKPETKCGLQKHPSVFCTLPKHTSKANTQNPSKQVKTP